MGDRLTRVPEAIKHKVWFLCLAGVEDVDEGEFGERVTSFAYSEGHRVLKQRTQGSV